MILGIETNHHLQTRLKMQKKYRLLQNLQDNKKRPQPGINLIGVNKKLMMTRKKSFTKHVKSLSHRKNNMILTLKS